MVELFRICCNQIAMLDNDTDLINVFALWSEYLSVFMGQYPDLRKTGLFKEGSFIPLPDRYQLPCTHIIAYGDIDTMHTQYKTRRNCIVLMYQGNDKSGVFRLDYGDVKVPVSPITESIEDIIKRHSVALKRYKHDSAEYNRRLSVFAIKDLKREFEKRRKLCLKDKLPITHVFKSMPPLTAFQVLSLITGRTLEPQITDGTNDNIFLSLLVQGIKNGFLKLDYSIFNKILTLCKINVPSHDAENDLYLQINKAIKNFEMPITPNGIERYIKKGLAGKNKTSKDYEKYDDNSNYACSGDMTGRYNGIPRSTYYRHRNKKGTLSAHDIKKLQRKAQERAHKKKMISIIAKALGKLKSTVRKNYKYYFKKYKHKKEQE